MLTLQRLNGQKVFLTDRVTGELLAEIQIVDVSRGKVKMGIEAPAHVLIMREELITATNTEDASNGV